jgi:hypothetical protein
MNAKFLLGISEAFRPLGSQRLRCENNIKANHEQIERDIAEFVLEPEDRAMR